MSVIIPTYNGVNVLGEQLDSLLTQTTPPDEVVIADNGSSDATVALALGYADRLPLVVVDASERQGNAAARNIGVARSSGDVLLFLDQDDRADASWIRAMADAVDDGVVVGRNVMVKDWSAGPSSDQPVAMPVETEFLPYGLSNNMAMNRQTFLALKGFDERYVAATDVDLCWRAQQKGVGFAEARDAVVYKRRKETLKGGFRQHRDFGRDDVQLFMQHKTHGMSRSWTRVARKIAWLLTRLPTLHSPERRAVWIRAVGRQWGRLLGSIRYRTVFL